MLQTIKRLIPLAAFAACSLSAGLAVATPIDPGLDFRDGTVWAGEGTSTFSHGAVVIDANGGRLYRDDVDGYGIEGGEHDEIDRSEILTVWFDAAYFTNPADYITGVLLTDLFDAPDGGSGGEAGWVTLLDSSGNTIASYFANAVSSVANGEFYLDFGGAFMPNSVVFSAYVGPGGAYTGSEYSVAGFTTVPEPATLLLLGSGLLGLALFRRRRLD